MRKLNYLLWAALLSVGLLAIQSCKKDTPTLPTGKDVREYDHAIASIWNETFLEVERYAPGYRPGPAPRALAYIGLAAYEACVPGMPDYNSVANQYDGLHIPAVEGGAVYHWPTVFNNTYAYLIKRFFTDASPGMHQKIEALASAQNDKFRTEAGTEVFERSKKRGEEVAQAVWVWSKTDTYGHDAYLDPFAGYNWQDHYKGPGDWVPTQPGPGKPMFPFWGKVRTFALPEAEKLCAKPLQYSENPNSPLYAQALEVYSRTISPSYEDVWISEFWSDDLLNLTFSPGPRWIAIANQVYEQEKSDLETAVYCNAKIGMALNDAAVACWYSKYYYNVERPVSYIQRLIDPQWKPLLENPLTGDKGITPSFPAYPSGHSTMGGAAAEVLTDVFGIAYSLTDRCHQNRSEFEGKPRTFESFYDMAEENALSRVPLGVHFRMDCEVGVSLGYRCGRRVNALPWKR